MAIAFDAAKAIPTPAITSIRNNRICFIKQSFIKHMLKDLRNFDSMF